MTISKTELLSSCENGDIILFDTRGHWYDTLIRLWTRSKFSHIGIVIRDLEIEGVKVGTCLLESGSEPFPDTVRGINITGVRVSKLEDVLDEYIDNKSGFVYYRKAECNRSEAFFANLKSSIETTYALPYDVLPQDWLRAAFGIQSGKRTERNNTFWCSALVAYVYDKLGFLPRDCPWTLISPRQFSFYEGKQLTFGGDLSLEPEVLVDL